MPESDSHRQIKKLVKEKLQKWFGVSVDEYPSSGHELDAFSVTTSGLSIYIEVVWNHSKVQFLSDMNMLQQSDSDIKLVIASPDVIADSEMTREFSKIVISQRRVGKKIWGDMINGQRILEDTEYADNDLKKIIFSLVKDATPSSKKENSIEIDSLSAVKSNLRTGNYFNIIGRIVCVGQRIIKRIDACLEFNEPQKVRYVSISNDGKVNQLDLKDLNYSWSPDGSDEKNTRGELPEMRQGDKIFVVFPDAVGFGFGSNGHIWWWKNFFEFPQGSSHQVTLLIRGIYGSKTVTAKKTIEFSA